MARHPITLWSPQWHPERSVDDDEHSRAIFRALVEAAEEKHRIEGRIEQAL
jgi:gamma-glutamyl-gamma-aminobutyrate hydrolase PuuD